MSMSVDFGITSEWDAGFVGQMTLNNLSGSSVDGWIIEFDAPFEITNLWNGEIVSHVGNHYVIRNASWNGTVGPNGEVSFGFQASKSGDVAAPADIIVNGTPIDAGEETPPPLISVADTTVTEGDDGTRFATFSVSLSKGSDSAISVDFATAPGTAAAGSDFLARSGTLTFAPGETTKTVRVPVQGDLQVEADETFRLVLSGPNGGTIGDGEGVATILDDDVVLPSLSIGNRTVTEGDSGTKNANFAVTLSEASDTVVTVAFETRAGTAAAGSDFVAQSGVLTFAPGETSKTVAIKIVGDPLVESRETFEVLLSDAQGATISDGAGLGRITDNDVVLPSLSIGNRTVTEGDSGTKNANFAVTLSEASDTVVTVSFETRAGTATAGGDFVAQSGVLTFAPGETSKTVAIKVVGDTLVESRETFEVLLSNAQGATISDGAGLGRITDNDVATVPTVSVADVSVTEGDPGFGGPAAGFFSTDGNQIVDADGNTVKIAGVNWFGMESGRFSPDGLHARNYQDMMDQMKELGFNTIRLPFSNQLFDPNSTAGSINYNLNPQLQGLTPLQIMDAVVDYAGEIGMRIILDHHRSGAGAGPNSNGLWYEGAYDEERWIDDWVMLAERYAGNSTVIGADLHNEPHAGTWGGGGATDWAAAAERAGNAIQAVNDDWLIVVEGVGAYDNQYYWWGGNLMGVADRPVDLDIDNKLVYSPHDYPNSIYAQPWFSDPSFPDNLTDKFDQMWGYIYKEGIAPILLGEFGSRLTDPKDVAWFEKITAYLAGDFDADGSNDLPAGDQGMSWTWWSWNPNSGDTGGILADDWQTVLQDKVDGLEPLMFTFEDVEGGSGAPTALTTVAEFDISLSAASDQAVTVDYSTADGTAGADDYNGVAGSVTFQPGETTKTVQVEVVRDTLEEGDETFVFNLSNPGNATLADSTATATIQDDDFVFIPPEPPPSDGSGGLTAAVTIDDDWGSGFVARVSLDNGGGTAVDDWSVRLEMPYEIVDIWNAEIVSHEGDVYEIRHTDWNDTVAPGQSVGFGFQATPGNATVEQFDWML